MQQIKYEIQENMTDFKFPAYYDSHKAYIRNFFSINKNVHLLIKFTYYSLNNSVFVPAGFELGFDQFELSAEKLKTFS